MFHWTVAQRTLKRSHLSPSLQQWVGVSISQHLCFLKRWGLPSLRQTISRYNSLLFNIAPYIYLSLLHTREKIILGKAGRQIRTNRKKMMKESGHLCLVSVCHGWPVGKSIKGLRAAKGGCNVLFSQCFSFLHFFYCGKMYIT